MSDPSKEGKSIKEAQYKAAREELRANLTVLNLLRAAKAFEAGKTVDGYGEAPRLARAAVRASVEKYVAAAADYGIEPGGHD